MNKPTCLPCRREGWCPSHGITDKARLEKWTKRATWDAQCKMLKALEGRAQAAIDAVELERVETWGRVLP